MGEPARKLNFMIKCEIADDLERTVPAGQRSRLVNEALRKELASYRRAQLTERLLALRDATPATGTDDIVAALREDRERGGR